MILSRICTINEPINLVSLDTRTSSNKKVDITATFEVLRIACFFLNGLTISIVLEILNYLTRSLPKDVLSHFLSSL